MSGRGPAESGNQRTIASYEGCAADYARSTKPVPEADVNETLAWFLDVLPADGRVLEIGSGPGWDADWLERRGVRVRRTDATLAFVEIQKARGAAAERLDIVTESLGGPYAGVVAQYVFQHIARSQLPDVLGRIARALVVDGAFLFTLREGGSDFIETGSDGGVYHIAEWARSDLDPILAGLGFQECWSRSSVDADGHWLTILTTRSGE